MELLSKRQSAPGPGMVVVWWPSTVVYFSWQLGNQATPLHPQTGATLLHVEPPWRRLNGLRTARSLNAYLGEVLEQGPWSTCNSFRLHRFGSPTETSSWTRPASLPSKLASAIPRTRRQTRSTARNRFLRIHVAAYPSGASASSILPSKLLFFESDHCAGLVS
ncbi:hypothetical protein CABS01_02318 [Colletotrichum abscissum]|uniref:uncharacterized protein n=1 Tax=Colletotrichum abscissum TaxID=1671311 RepID=UPI0027D4A9B9|nr:uncharacterized protein CABS01_02318 [Colletotrichum abscissum]KAK1488688.1 hypothetical protein CABS01_02318 [Colletotrichum abscissum]